VFEDALAGVEAGAAGGFAAVVGVDRIGHGHAEDLRRHGATRVVADLAELLDPPPPPPPAPLPNP
jgi:beta-phosphoglucomutase-like phosphatase (HAD superfamily)